MLSLFNYPAYMLRPRWRLHPKVKAPSLEEGSPAPDIATLMDFVRFHAAIGKGNIDNKKLITADSSNTFMEWFFAGFARVTGTQVDEEDRKKFYHVSR